MSTRNDDTTLGNTESPKSKPTDGSKAETTEAETADTTTSTHASFTDVTDDIPPPSFLTAPIKLATSDVTSAQDQDEESRKLRARDHRNSRPSYNDDKSLFAIQKHAQEPLPEEERDARRDEADRARAHLEEMLPAAAAEYNLGTLVATILAICREHRETVLRGGVLNHQRLLKELEAAVAEPQVLDSVPKVQHLPGGKRAHNKDPLRIAKMGVSLIAQLIFINNNQHETDDDERLLPAAVVKYISSIFSLDEGSVSSREMGKIVRKASESIRDVELVREREQAEAKARERERVEAEAKKKAEGKAKKKAEAEAKRKPPGNNSN